jgi:Putative beta-lactamase-inhibitor-like, PepSY-like
MKKLLFLILAAGFIAAPAFAKIPAKITVAFQSRYGGATNVEWQHTLVNYKASFNLGDYRLHAKFDRKGKWLESEKMLQKDRLPVTVKNSLRKTKYGDWKIKSSYLEYLPNEQPRYHITAAKGDIKRKSLVFDYHGQLIKG